MEQWTSKNSEVYASIEFRGENTAERVEQYAPHEWNGQRFHVLGQIRQVSIDYALEKNCHYFTSDVDNFITPITLKNMVDANLPVLAPMLTTATGYSNYHHKATTNGYLDTQDPAYYPILERSVKGLIEQDVVHCTYFIHNEVLRHVSYEDGSGRHEYVIFSDSLRKAGIPQFLDNRYEYGRISFADTLMDLENEGWIQEFRT